jgi:acetyl-CoA carboxylase biotin carboxyl carrier protein
MAEGLQNEHVLLTDEVRELLRLVAQSDITELHIEHGSAKIHLKRAQPTVAHAHVAPAATGSYQALAPAPPMAPAPAPAEPAFEIGGALTINSPMVGTYYTSPAPNEPPFVQEGEEVHPGMVVGIVEAMKMMNEIESDVAGRVLRVLVQNGQPVEYGQPLFVVEPL